MRRQISSGRLDIRMSQKAFIATKMADVCNLRVNDLKKIAIIQKSAACVLLANKIGLESYNKEENLNTDIYVDYLYDHLIFAVERGLPWDNMVEVVNFANDLLKYSHGKSLAETVFWYRSEAEELYASLGERFFKMYTEFIFSTFFTHYQLYQYVLTQNRDVEIPKINIEVIPPETPHLFKDGKELKVYEYEKKLCDIERRECECLNSMLKEKEESVEESEVKKTEIFQNYKQKGEPITKESLSEMVKDILTCYTSSLTNDIKSDIVQTQESLRFKLEKISLPRPQVLGPPQKYKLRSPGSRHDKHTDRKTPETKPKSGRKSASGKVK